MKKVLLLALVATLAVLAALPGTANALVPTGTKLVNTCLASPGAPTSRATIIANQWIRGYVSISCTRPPQRLSATLYLFRQTAQFFGEDDPTALATVVDKQTLEYPSLSSTVVRNYWSLEVRHWCSKWTGGVYYQYQIGMVVTVQDGGLTATDTAIGDKLFIKCV